MNTDLPGDTPATPPILIATGCYSRSGRGRGVELLALDAGTGRLEPLASLDLEDPTFLAWSADGSVLYAVHETFPARVSALRVSPDGRSLTLARELELTGAGGCHVALGPRERTLVVADYGSGHVEVVALDADGLPESVLDAVDHAHVRLGREAHPHQARVLPGTDLIAVPDLGLDNVFLYEQDVNGHLELAGQIPLPAGSGPRHVAADHESSVLYISCELSGRLATAPRDQRAEGPVGWTVQADIPASGRQGENAVSHVEISERENHVFVASRGPDTLGAVSLGPMRPELVAEVAVGAHPRHFARLEDGLILVAAQEADRIDVLRWDGRAFETLGSTASPSVSCIVPRPAQAG